MPTIKIPPHAVIYQDDGSLVKDPFEFVSHFMNRTVLRDQKQFGSDADGLYAAMEIRGLISKKEPGNLVTFTESHMKRIQEATRNPTVPYNIPLMVQCPDYLNAILKPEEK